MGSCTQRAEPEIHLIPAGFRGRVDILFDRPDGLPPKYEGKFRVYEIPISGVLKTQFKFSEGIFYEGDLLIYSVDSLGERTRVNIVDNHESFHDSVSVQAHSFISGGKLLEECNLFVDNIYEYIVDVPKKDSSYLPFQLKCRDVIND